MMPGERDSRPGPCNASWSIMAGVVGIHRPHDPCSMRVRHVLSSLRPPQGVSQPWTSPTGAAGKPFRGVRPMIIYLDFYIQHVPWRVITPSY